MQPTTIYTIDAIDSDAPAIALAVVIQPAGEHWQIQPIYHDHSLRPLAQLDCLYVPAVNGDALLDAAIAFYPAAFGECIALGTVRRHLPDTSELDLTERLPIGWAALRVEARWRFREMGLRRAEVRMA